MKKRILIEAALLEFIAAAGCILVVDNWALGALLIVAGIIFLFLSSRYKEEPNPKTKTKKKKAK
jgi:hypothetical protein